MAAEGFEEWLEAPVDEAAQCRSVGLYRADSRSALDLVGGRDPDELDLHPVDWELVSHALRLGPRRSREIGGITESG